MNVAFDSRMAFTTPVKLPETSVISADSIAMSVPVPIAIPTFACFKAGASFIPSPTMATVFPSDCNFLTTSILSRGKSSARTSSIPTRPAIALAGFLDKKLINEGFAQNLLTWRHSGFSINNEIKVYEVRAFTCPKCNFEMNIIAVIMDPEEIRKILQHLVKIGRSPPGLNPVSLN